MKRLSLVFFIITSIFSLSSLAQQPLTIQPEKPKAGEKISISYNTTGTELFGVDKPEAYAHLLEGALPLVKEIKLLRKGNLYTGEFTTTDTTKAVFLTFSKDEKRDNNNDKGYFTMLYNNAGKPVPGAMKAVAQGYGSFGGTLGP